MEMDTSILKSDFMNHAMRLAEKAAQLGEVPVGAVVVSPDRQILGEGYNRVLRDKDPSAHAELVAIRAAAQRLGSERLIDCDLYVTLEPCPMCAQAISFARIRRLYYGAGDEKGGGVDHGARIFAATSCHHKPEVYSGIGEVEASALLKDFFHQRR